MIFKPWAVTFGLTFIENSQIAILCDFWKALLRAAKGAAFGIRELLQKLDQNFCYRCLICFLVDDVLLTHQNPRRLGFW